MGDSQDNYISIFQAKDMLNVSSERITWFITTEKLSSKRNPRDKSTKLVSLQDVLKLQDCPHLLARWVIYILRDPRDDAVRYVGQTNEPFIRFHRHLGERSDHAKYKWICELKEQGLRPSLEVLEGLNSSQADVDEREVHWIQYFLKSGTKLLNKNLELRTNGTPATRSLLINQSEWVPMVEVAERLGVRRMLLSRLATRGVIQTKDNPLDARVKLVNFIELRALFEQYGPRLGDDDET